MPSVSQRTIRPSFDFLAALSRTNSAIVRIRDPQALFDEICAICVDHGIAKVAYIAMADEGGYARPVASAGPAKAFLSDIEIPLRPVPGAQPGPIATAIQRGQPYVANDLHADPSTPPWRPRAISIGSNATAAFPIHRGTRVVGALSLHVTRKGFFDAAVVELLQAMADDLSYALENIDREGERAEAVREAEVGRERFRTIFDVTPAATAIWCESAAGPVDANDSFCVLLGLDPNDRGTDAFQIEARRCYDELDLATHAARLRANHRVRDHEARLRSRSGHLRDVSISAKLITCGDETCMLTVITDITERKMYEASQEHFVTHDNVTGLPNRRLFYSLAAQAIAKCRRTNTVAALVLADLDRMKFVNDEHGHRVGDEALRLVGERLRALVPDGDPIARLSGDEFVMLLTGLRAPPDVQSWLARIGESLSSPIWAFGTELRLSASVGVAFFPSHGTEIDELVRKADRAMYTAKSVGNGAHALYGPEMMLERGAHNDLAPLLRRAVGLEQLFVEYQPKIRMSDGRIAGAEALLRWHHPERGLIAPTAFVPVAEETGLIVEIGQWVLREACAQAVAWQARGLPAIAIAVNVSAHQLLHSNFETQVLDALQLTGLKPELLELEITESVIAKDLERVSTAIGDLRAIGVRFAIDDFGTGYSSLGYLKRFRVDRVKVDQSFVRDVPSDQANAAIVRAVVSLAKSVGLEVTAEGIETDEQCRFVDEAGCDEIQGYLFSRPVSANEFEVMLRARTTLDVSSYRRCENTSSVGGQCAR